MVGGEMPIHLYPLQAPISKDQMEELHLQKFCTDFCLAFGARPYVGLRRGEDPPDFIGLAPEGVRRIDCTQFVVGSRRASQAMFRSVRRAIFDAGPDRFSHLTGLLLWVWATTSRDLLDLPLRGNTQQELLNGLELFRFQSEMGVSYGPEVPEQAPDFGIQTSASGWRYYAVPLLVAAPSSPFFVKMGFEIAYNYPTEHTSLELWEEFKRVVMQHDQPSVDDLIITVGGPDREGYQYLGEDALFDFMIRTMTIPPLPLQHTKRVLVHRWESGSIIQFYPTYGTISRGPHQLSVPAHQPLVPNES